MRKEIKFSESTGRTIESVRYSNLYPGAVVTFTDGAFSTLGIHRGHEPSDDEICDDELSVLDFGDHLLIEIGVISADELDVIRHERRHLEQKASEQAERREFERLKKKFGV